MSRVYNFCAGPAAMPEPVLRRAQEEFLSWGKRGSSVLEMSHRSDEFVQIARHSEQGLRDLMHIPENYKILLLQGGASAQFAFIPMNILGAKRTADYISTGIWSEKAIEEARNYCDVNVAATGAADGYTRIPDRDQWKLNPNAAYVHYTPNETVNGVEFHWVPDTEGVPLVADMSSTILSRPIDVAKCARIYAGAQKNIGPSGIAVIIVREDLIGRALPQTPRPFDYAVQVKDASLYNTPPTFGWYLIDLVFDWLKEQGGPEAMGPINASKAARLYQVIDDSDFYSNAVAAECRSWMNIPFRLADARLDPVFLQEAAENRLVNLNGFRSVGGMRASIYNAVPEAAVDALCAFMRDFEKRHG
mgnify:CR=1 FL=1